MMKCEADTVTNGHGEDQEVVTGKLSLINVPGFPRVAADNLQPPPQEQQEYKFPIETYAGLERANAERIAKFEAETKAMMQRSGLAKSSTDLAEGSSLRGGSSHQG